MGFNWAFVCDCKAQFKPNNICANIIVLEMGLIVNENAWIRAQNGLHSIHINHFFCFAFGFFGLVFFLRTSSSHSMLNQIKKWLAFSDKLWIVRLRVSGVARSHKPISCQQQITFDDHTHARVNHKLILTHIPFFTVDDLRNGHPVFARLHPDGLDNLYLVARHHEPAKFRSSCLHVHTHRCDNMHWHIHLQMWTKCDLDLDFFHENPPV